MLRDPVGIVVNWRSIARPWRFGLVLLFMSLPVAAEILPDPQVTEYQPADVREELQRFDAVGDGLALTLAACDDEPHCVDGISQHEIARLIDRIQQRIEHLITLREQDDLGDPWGDFLDRYRGLRGRYVGFLRQVWEVVQRVDSEDLDQDWEDLLDFEVAAPEETKPGRDVPDPNGQLTLQRFQDEHEPMPIE